MRSTLGQAGPERPYGRPSPNGTPAGITPSTREMPYDYLARFQLTGQPGNRPRDVINIDTDGIFVALSLEYVVHLAPHDTARTAWEANPNFKELVKVLTDEAEGTVWPNIGLNTLWRAVTGIPDTGTVQIRPILLDPRDWLMRLGDLSFRYSISDGASRALQNQAVPCRVPLAATDEERPLRRFARPMVYQPRASITIEIEEISEGLLFLNAELSLILRGYKILGDLPTRV